MKHIFLFLLLLTGLTTRATAHPIHVSVCEMECDTDADRIEITIKIFADDLTEVLNERHEEKIDLHGNQRSELEAEYLFEYLKEKFTVAIDGRPVELNWIGYEIEDIAAWCYLSVEGISAPGKIEISNRVMTHWFNDQVNVVHFDCHDKMNSTFFSKGRETDVFEFH